MTALSELPALNLAVGGSSIPLNTMRCLDKVTVLQELSSPTVCELVFRGTPEMFPGAGEHADR